MERGPVRRSERLVSRHDLFCVMSSQSFLRRGSLVSWLGFQPGLQPYRVAL